jgi:hypothetical protein
MNDEVEHTLTYLRDSGRNVHIWGALNCDAPAYNGCRVEATRARPDGPGEIPTPDAVEGWPGTLARLPQGAQFDDVFLLDIPGFAVQYGIETADPDLEARLSTLAETGAPFFVFGELTCGVIDVNGCQIMVTRIEGDRE